MASSLNDQLLAHQIATIKHAAGLGQSVIPYLNEMKAIIRKKVAGFDSEKRTAKRLETMLNTLANTLNKPAGAWLAELEKSLKEFAKYEAVYQADTIGGWVGVNLTEPTIGQVWAAAQFQPLALSTSPIDFEKMMDDWGVDEVNRLVMGCKQGFVEGLTTRQIIKNVVGDGGLADISLRNAKSVANTAMMHVATNARMAVMEENDDVVIGYELVATLDNRTSVQCFTGETELAPIAGMDAIMRGSYSGEVITVELANGKKFTGTPEHPILTQYGWTPLKEIDPREHILYTVTDEVIVLEVVQDVNMPARADDIFDAFADFSSGEMVSASPTAADFYGDGVRLNGEIDIVRTNCKLRNYINTSSREQAGNVFLGSVHAAGMLPRNSSKHPFILREFPVDMPALNEVELFNKAVENGFADASRPDALRWRHSACEQLDSSPLVGKRIVIDPTAGSVLHEAELLEKCRDGRSGNAVLLGYDASGNPITVCGTNIISVRSELKTCHVYTLSSGQGYYAAGSAIVKNCRSLDGKKIKFTDKVQPKPPFHFSCRTSVSPWLSPEFDIFDEGATRASKGADGGKQVSADLTYYSWLKQQPAAFQDEVLGQEKGKIFRNSGIDAETFRKITVDDLGRALTLKEMAEADKRVASYLAK